DLARTERELLCMELGNKAGTRLAELARGVDDGPVEQDTPDKGMSAEETFEHDVAEPEEGHSELLRLSEKEAGRKHAWGPLGRTVSVKLRRCDFTTFPRSRTLPESTGVGREISAGGRGLYDAAGRERTRVRLVGVRVEGIGPAEHAHRKLTLGEEDT